MVPRSAAWAAHIDTWARANSGSGLPGPKGASARTSADSARSATLGRDQGVDFQCVSGLRSAISGFRACAQKGAKIRYEGRPHRQARRHGVPAAGQQQSLAR